MIEVWADVGGTFTDCFVTRDGRCTVTKVLSSGIVRVPVLERVEATGVRIGQLPGPAIDRFWVGASIAEIDPDGSRRVIGQATGFQTNRGQIETDRELPARVAEGTLIELDAGLEAPVLAARMLLGVPLREPLPESEVRLGTTRGTNALLTRGGADTALLVTRGFRDLMKIGEQDRPDLFALAIRKPAPLTRRVVEVDGRLDAAGRVLQPLDESRLRRELRALRATGVESLAICLLHAHVDDVHERRCERIAREVGFTEISRSAEVAPLIKVVSRAETATLDAYLNPVLSAYVARVWDQFGGDGRCRLRLMTSGGNLMAPAGFRGRDSILSGPAGGVVALGHVARSTGLEAAIGLDMGGTSTDVSRFQGQVGRRYESRVAGIRVMTPMMDIHTVAAGGGSVCDFRGATSDAGGRLVVGPDSAAADPGPACYGRGGPLTLTDVNLILGRVPVERFPFPLDRRAARARLREIETRVPQPFESPEELAEGFFEIAVTHMAEAVRAVSTSEGNDVREMCLVGFGGAAGQHLCRVAATLGMPRVLDHPDAAMLSALGIGLADVGRVVTRGIYRPLDDDVWAFADPIVAEIGEQAEQELRPEHDGTRRPELSWECDLRYSGTDSSLAVALEPKSTLRTRFAEKHRGVFGYERPEHTVELVAIRCEATLPSKPPVPRHTARSEVKRSWTRFWHRGALVDAELVDRDALTDGDPVVGPQVIASETSTLIVEPGWQGSVRDGGVIELFPVDVDPPERSRRDATAERSTESGGIDQDSDDPVLVEVVARRLQGIADAMGETLRRTAVSVNVKERRDYSCAVFRGDGSLVANAPHVPVHLGAMGHTVRRMIEVFPEMSPGDCYLSNDPYSGGSHLPDVTLVTPVFVSRTRRPDFFVASRAHHAEIGGRTPGSMPPDATSLAEEGVVIRDFALVRNGASFEAELRERLASGRYPSRNIDENLADVAAQAAAGHEGTRDLIELATRLGVETVDRMMRRLLELAGDAISGWIATQPDQPRRFHDSLDDGTPVAVRIERHGGRLTIDFAGTGAVHPHGFNATPSIVTAATMYVLRSITGSELPLCEGVLRDVDLKIPRGLLDPPAGTSPETCAAVVAGNVETSQRVVDVLLGALHAAAASQGTMNNLLIGDATFGYYETIGGGSGATAEADGADAVHSHMTNTRITDPEVLESRLPVRLLEFSIRANSGGTGVRRGGNGIVRELEFLRPLTVSLITSRRTTTPYGMSGGEPGKSGLNRLIRDGRSTELEPTATFDVRPGDRLRLETPGGGGWGAPQPTPPEPTCDR